MLASRSFCSPNVCWTRVACLLRLQHPGLRPRLGPAGPASGANIVGNGGGALHDDGIAGPLARSTHTPCGIGCGAKGFRRGGSVASTDAQVVVPTSGSLQPPLDAEDSPCTGTGLSSDTVACLGGTLGPGAAADSAMMLASGDVVE